MQSKQLSSPGIDEENKENTGNRSLAAPANKVDNIKEVQQPRRYRLLSRRNRAFVNSVQSERKGVSAVDGGAVMATSKAEQLPAPKPSRQDRPFAVKIHVQSKASSSGPEATRCDNEKENTIGDGGMVSRATEQSKRSQPLGRKLSRLKRLKRLGRGNWGSG